MTGFVQWLLMLALGAFVTFLVAQWQGFIGDKDLAFLIGFPLLCLIAWIYDRRQARLQKSNTATTELD
jgi:cyanate permease